MTDGTTIHFLSDLAVQVVDPRLYIPAPPYVKKDEDIVDISDIDYEQI